MGHFSGSQSRLIKVYDGQGAQLVMSEREFLATKEAKGLSRTAPKTIDQMDEKELNGQTVADLKAYLDSKQVEYDANSKKSDLVKVVLGK